MNAQPRQRFENLQPAQQAGIICNDARFQKFAATRCGIPDQRFTPSAAAHFLRDCCQIASRRDLNANAEAIQKFQTLRTEFDAWAGRIPSPR